MAESQILVGPENRATQRPCDSHMSHARLKTSLEGLERMVTRPGNLDVCSNPPESIPASIT